MSKLAIVCKRPIILMWRLRSYWKTMAKRMGFILVLNKRQKMLDEVIINKEMLFI